MIFLAYQSESEGGFTPMTLHATYNRGSGVWVQRLPWYGSFAWYGPKGPPGSTDGLDGKAISKAFTAGHKGSESGEPALVVGGWHSAEVATISLVQDDEYTGQRATGHYGAWIIGSESDEPWKVEARDRRGRLVGVVSSSPWSRSS